MNNISCIGEMLIDFICTDIDTDLADGKNFRKHAGGAPANVTAAIARLGGNSSFIGTVGSDPFGKFLRKSIQDTGVDTSMMYSTDSKPTTIVFVSLKADGERDFVFNRGADEVLSFDELDLQKIQDSCIVHFGSATALLEGRLQKTYLELIEYCRSRRIFVSFDPNYRVDLWRNNEAEFIRLSADCIRKADFIKLSEEELYLLTGLNELEDAAASLERSENSILTITLGSRGTMVCAGGKDRIVGSVKIKSIDSTGAGDAFTGAFLLKTAELDDLFSLYNNPDTLDQITAFSNKVGAIVCTKLGAIASLPAIDEVEAI